MSAVYLHRRATSVTKSQTLLRKHLTVFTFVWELVFEISSLIGNPSTVKYALGFVFLLQKALKRLKSIVRSVKFMEMSDVMVSKWVGAFIAYLHIRTIGELHRNARLQAARQMSSRFVIYLAVCRVSVGSGFLDTSQRFCIHEPNLCLHNRCSVRKECVYYL